MNTTYVKAGNVGCNNLQEAEIVRRRPRELTWRSMPQQTLGAM